MTKEKQRLGLRSSSRFALVAILIVLGIVYCIGRMVFFAYSEQGDRWREIGKRIDRPEPKTLEPIRGTIYASDGRPIALTATYYKIRLDFRAQPLALAYNDSLKLSKDSVKIAERKALRDSLSRELDKLANALEESFRAEGITIDKRAMRERWRTAFQKRSQPLLTQHEISYLQYLRLQKVAPLAPVVLSNGHSTARSLLSKLIVLEERTRRINPFESLALRTIGSVYAQKKDGLSVGKQGLEMYYDSLLRGQVGEGIYIKAAQRKSLRIITPAVDGASVYTTLDMNKQNLLERTMRSSLMRYGARSGTAVLMEVQTGRIIAITNLERTRADRYVESINFAVSDLSEPGSTFKTASMLVALNDGIVSPSDTIDVGNGTWIVSKRVVRDHNAHRGGYGKLTAQGVLEQSSNVGTAKIILGGYAQRPEEFVDKVRALGFGLDLNVEIPGSAQARIRKPSDNPARWYGTTLAWMSFGYETQIPPLYTLAFYNAIANGGRFMRPMLVSEVRGADHEELLHREPETLIEQIARPEAIAMIQEMLRGVVLNGTGKALRSDVVAISGKSGTAQIARGGSYSGEGGRSHEVSFCAYFPSEAPRYSMIVVIREPDKQFPPSGGTMAGGVIREVAEQLISREQTSPLDSLPRLEPSAIRPKGNISGPKATVSALARQAGLDYTGSEGLVDTQLVQVDPTGRERALPSYAPEVVPNVVGLQASDAHYILMEHGYNVELQGYGRVASQSLPAGSRVRRGATIRLSLT